VRSGGGRDGVGGSGHGRLGEVREESATWSVMNTTHQPVGGRRIDPGLGMPSAARSQRQAEQDGQRLEPEHEAHSVETSVASGASEARRAMGRWPRPRWAHLRRVDPDDPEG